MGIVPTWAAWVAVALVVAAVVAANVWDRIRSRRDGSRGDEDEEGPG